VDPGFAAAHYGLAQLLESTGRTDDAVAEYEKTLALQDNHEDAAQALARLKKK
jgi:predicted RNA polymerase sigma factor